MNAREDNTVQSNESRSMHTEDFKSRFSKVPFPAFFISTLSDKENNRSLRAKSQLSADGIENFLF